MVIALDTINNTWTTKAPTFGALFNSAAAAANGNLYTFGGQRTVGGAPLITPSTKLMTLFTWQHIGHGVRKNSFSRPWASPA